LTGGGGHGNDDAVHRSPSWRRHRGIPPSPPTPLLLGENPSSLDWAATGVCWRYFPPGRRHFGTGWWWNCAARGAAGGGICVEATWLHVWLASLASCTL
jgi:hypothetical protein